MPDWLLYFIIVAFGYVAGIATTLFYLLVTMEHDLGSMEIDPSYCDEENASA